jgi:DNA polymerase
MFIGEAPGTNEVARRVPFCGKSGRILDETLDMVGMNRENLYITNLIKCHPPNNRNPRESEVRNCMAILMDEVRYVDPKFIMTLGRYATYALLPMLKGRPMRELHGWVEERKELEGKSRFILVAKHPASVMYSNSSLEAYSKPFKQLEDMLTKHEM